MKYRTAELLSGAAIAFTAGVIIAIIGVVINMPLLLMMLFPGIAGVIIGWNWSNWFKAIILKLAQKSPGD